ncbi:MAG: hypothetical protein ABFD15_06615 [Methanofastidiosum sp.]
MKNISVITIALLALLIMGGIIYVEKKFREQNAKISQFNSRTEYYERILESSAQTNLVPIINSMINILSNQTQSIKIIKDIIKSQIISNGTSIMEEMQPSSTNEIDIIIAEPMSFYKAFLDNQGYIYFLPLTAHVRKQQIEQYKKQE